MITADDVKTRLAGIGYTAQSADDALIAHSVDCARRYILNFCNVTSVPDALTGVWIDAAAGEFLYVKKACGALGDAFDFEAAVTSIKEGDTQVSLSSGTSTAEAAFDAMLDEMRKPDVTQLLRFRRLVW